MKIKLKIGDILLIVFIFILSIGILYVSNKRLINNDTKKKYAIIQVNGVEVNRIKIDKDSEGLILPIESEFGRNVLEFTSDGVRSIEASCPDQIDVKQGFIYNVGETIICLPNRMVVEIVTEANVNDVDVVN